MKVVLLSHFSLPFSGIASWTTMMNYYLFDVNNQIDYVVCPDSELELKFSDRKKLNKLSLFDKIISKSDKTKRFNNYINQLRKILSEEKLSYIIMINSEDYSLHIKETEDLSWATRDSDWNLSLNSSLGIGLGLI